MIKLNKWNMIILCIPIKFINLFMKTMNFGYFNLVILTYSINIYDFWKSGWKKICQIKIIAFLT